VKTSLLLLSGLCWPLLATAQLPGPFAPKPAVPPGWRLIHGDILERESSTEGVRAAGAFRGNLASYWPGGIVPYEFDANVSASNRTAMLNTMALWEGAANVDFVEITPGNGQNDYVHIQHSTANNSAVGRSGGQQIINITSWDSQIIIAHELGHCLGYWHTQSRPDRDSFVRINWANIQSQATNNFQIESDILTYGPYDYDSVMHYDQCAFSLDCPAGTSCGCTNTTIDALPPNEAQQTRMGQRDHLSYWDTLVMSFLYSYDADRFVDWSFGGTEAGTFFSPFRTFAAAEASVPNHGHVWILRPGHYPAVGTHAKPTTISAPIGGVTLGN
jgi:hypothetical protein